MTAQEMTKKPKQEVKEEERTRPGRAYVPDVDIYEDEGALYLLADLPGVEQEKVTVELNEDVLSLEAEPSIKEYEGLTPLYTEYNVGRFLRRFKLPAGQFDRDRITARMRDGVLEIELPKAQAAKPRRIQVTS